MFDLDTVVEREDDGPVVSVASIGHRQDHELVRIMIEEIPHQPAELRIMQRGGDENVAVSRRLDGVH